MQAIVNFILEIDKLKGVTRKTRPLGLERFENSAEHSWQIALFAFAMAHYANEPIDIHRVISLLLVHDIGEIDTGDTMVYVEEGLAERKEAERVAVERIFGLLDATGRDQFLALWHEFENNETAESRFAHAVDRAMPVLLNLANNGQSWVEHGITHARVVGKIREPIERGCPALWAHLETELLKAERAGWYGMAVA